MTAELNYSSSSEDEPPPPYLSIISQSDHSSRQKQSATDTHPQVPQLPSITMPANTLNYNCNYEFTDDHPPNNVVQTTTEQNHNTTNWNNDIHEEKYKAPSSAPLYHRYNKQTKRQTRTTYGKTTTRAPNNNKHQNKKYPKLFALTLKENPWNPWDKKNANDPRSYGIVNKAGGPGIGRNKPYVNIGNMQMHQGYRNRNQQQHHPQNRYLKDGSDRRRPISQI